MGAAADLSGLGNEMDSDIAENGRIRLCSMLNNF